jgi:hypothetical protein
VELRIMCRRAGDNNIIGGTRTKKEPERDINGKAIPLQALTSPEGSRRLRLPDFLRQSAHEGGKGVSPTHRPPSSPGNIPDTHFC